MLIYELLKVRVALKFCNTCQDIWLGPPLTSSLLKGIESLTKGIECTSNVSYIPSLDNEEQ